MEIHKSDAFLVAKSCDKNQRDSTRLDDRQRIHATRLRQNSCGRVGLTIAEDRVGERARPCRHAKDRRTPAYDYRHQGQCRQVREAGAHLGMGVGNARFPFHYSIHDFLFYGALAVYVITKAYILLLLVTM